MNDTYVAANVSTLDVRAEDNVKLRWGAIWSGVFVSLGLWLLLHVLGVAAGLNAVDPEDGSTLRAALIGTGIWSAIAPLLALLAGGLVTARGAGFITRRSGALTV